MYRPCLLIHIDSAKIDRIPLGIYDTVEEAIASTIYRLVERGLLDRDLYMHMLQEKMPDNNAEDEWDKLYNLTRESVEAYEAADTYEEREACFIKQSCVYADYLIKKTYLTDSNTEDIEAYRLKRLQEILLEYGDIPLSCMGFIEAFSVEFESA